MSSLIHFETGDGKTGVIAGYSDGGFFHVVFNSDCSPRSNEIVDHLHRTHHRRRERTRPANPARFNWFGIFRRKHMSLQDVTEKAFPPAKAAADKTPEQAAPKGQFSNASYSMVQGLKSIGSLAKSISAKRKPKSTAETDSDADKIGEPGGIEA
jgi:hypothetical protein